jgi:hypothetical protein
MIWKESGSLSESWFKNKDRNGQGRVMMKSGIVYEGGFLNDKTNGHGNIITSHLIQVSALELIKAST